MNGLSSLRDPVGLSLAFSNLRKSAKSVDDFCRNSRTPLVPQEWRCSCMRGNRHIASEVAAANLGVIGIMSKMQCRCGHVISDFASPCVTEARVIGDTAFEHFETDFSRQVAAFLASTRDNTRAEWLVEHFGEIYPSDLPDAEVISDLLDSSLRKYAVSMAECERCGRLWLQRKVGQNLYRSFAPDEGGYESHLADVSSSTHPGQ